jgi:polyhydroxybutyrate depolymerase
MVVAPNPSSRHPETDARTTLSNPVIKVRTLSSCLLFLALILTGCGAGPSISSDANPVHARLSKPSTGCSHPGLQSQMGSMAPVISVGGSSHAYLLSLPTHYDAHRPSAMILEFQGYGSTARSMAELTHMPSRGAAQGYIVVTPEGPGHTWQLSGSGADASYIDSLVSSLMRTLCVDTNRVYAAGFSQGAAFAILYGCSHPNQIAAISTVAVEFQLGCSKPMPFLAFHGTADPAVPYQNGGVGLSLPGVKVRGTMLNMSDWAHLDRCRTAPATTVIGMDVRFANWQGCADGNEVGLYSVVGGGHTWPGADPRITSMHTAEEISATALMLTFFSRHHLS